MEQVNGNTGEALHTLLVQCHARRLIDAYRVEETRVYLEVGETQRWLRSRTARQYLEWLLHDAEARRPRVDTGRDPAKALPPGLP